VCVCVCVYVFVCVRYQLVYPPVPDISVGQHQALSQIPGFNSIPFNSSSLMQSNSSKLMHSNVSNSMQPNSSNSMQHNYFVQAPTLKMSGEGLPCLTLGSSPQVITSKRSKNSWWLALHARAQGEGNDNCHPKARTTLPFSSPSGLCRNLLRWLWGTHMCA
jgi:hypothetical protein